MHFALRVRRHLHVMNARLGSGAAVAIMSGARTVG